MRKRKVPKEQISIFRRHLPKGSDATTSIYAPYEPDYCGHRKCHGRGPQTPEARQHRRARSRCRGVGKVHFLQDKAGIGDAKSEEVRFLILSGLPHAEAAKRSGLSSGTVNLIRSEMREVIPLYRNSESSSDRSSSAI
jgi:hypothetical protein